MQSQQIQSLWKGKIQRANYPPPLQQPPMILPNINRLVGGHKPESPSIHDQLNASYARYSAAYWAGVAVRARMRKEAHAAAAAATAAAATAATRDY